MGPRLGSRERPLPIRQICHYGDSSTRMRPGLAKVLLQTKQLPLEVVKDWAFEIPVGGKKAWVRLQPCGFNPRAENPERFVTPSALREPSVLITAFKPGTLGAEYYVKRAPLNRAAFEDRVRSQRVHYMDDRVMAALDTGMYGARLTKLNEVLDEWRAGLMKHIESELMRGEAE